jgi:hypothetical protein
LGSRKIREKALTDIIVSWRKIALRRDYILRMIHDYLFPKERQKINIASGVKGEDVEKGKQALSSIKSVSEEQKRIAKDIERRLEQCRLIIVHQKKKIKEFEKNL